MNKNADDPEKILQNVQRVLQKYNNGEMSAIGALVSISLWVSSPSESSFEDITWAKNKLIELSLWLNGLPVHVQKNDKEE